MDGDANCDTFAEVDFGHGPVQIRCTQVGKHAQCRCEVMIPTNREKAPTLVPPANVVNIFERNANETG